MKPEPPSATPGAEARLEIRSARATDLDALAALENVLFATDRLSRRSFRRFISSRADILLVAAEGGVLRGYALVLLRRGTAVARLYSIAVEPGAQGRGIATALVAACEEVASKRGAMVVRLEARVDNVRALKLYEKFGYRVFGRYKDYYDDGTDALRLEKILKRGLPAHAQLIPHYPQTTEFTCGPAAMMMAMAAFDPRTELNRENEFRLWREATTIFMTSGHGGCEPVGMAVALARRGLDVEVFVSVPPPYLLDTVRNPDKRAVMELIQAEFSREADRLGVRRTIRALKARDIAEKVKNGAIAIVLVSGYRMFDEKFPHWLVVHGVEGKHLFVHDPWVDPDFFENPAAATNVPIPMPEFERMAQYGRSRLRAAIIVKGRRP
jgi:ribosomal protein S18 acetylase RimI-like enzyme